MNGESEENWVGLIMFVAWLVFLGWLVWVTR